MVSEALLERVKAPARKVHIFGPLSRVESKQLNMEFFAWAD
jgi:hypothetical protein